MAKILSDKKKLRAFAFKEAAKLGKTAPVCRHFGDCGGCEFQDIPYGEQLGLKRRMFDFIAGDVADGLRERAAADKDSGAEPSAGAERLAAGLVGVEPEVVASPRTLGYRQRMDFVFAFGKAGLRRVNRYWDVVDLSECPLLGEKPFAAFQAARKLADEAGLAGYDYVRHAGELRYFVVRRTRNGDVLLSLVTKSREAGEKVRDVLRRLVGEGIAASAHWLLAEGMGDVSFGEPLWHCGAPWIVETILGKTFRIGPNSFFQANPDVAGLAYAKIRDFAPPGGSVLDMYSGTGAIALALAGGGASVLAAETIPENVELAKANIAENGGAGVTIVESDAVACLEGLAAARDVPGMVVANPPRPGVGERGMAAIRRIRAERFAYLSCNPFTLLRDLARVLDVYELRSLTLYDMFPQTRHFEVLALLERFQK